ncbi:type 1 glutamine amidotransferase [Nocardioides acrostichi]|uniref:Type 1 glutamine amidotransferase n=1 Tax=Nocardioides acrostichi TaxID=2784339 RepID=A0A930V166_9ACTN|nr:type 1 glutamine amidotransferase [Nocardioides acrostichi]MBF4162790.1 type 1 glutamine amidotransferase [Nocardioides acrostichi]
MSAKCVLVVQHEDPCPPGMVGDWLREAGCDLDVRRAHLGDPLPDDLTAHAGFMVLGGAANADDDVAWFPQTKALVRAAAATGVPALGICLGHQVFASALGGRVVRNPQGAQHGLLPVGWLPEATDDPLVGGLTGTTRDGARVGVHWNGDIVAQLPEGAVRLASAPGGEVQAARFAASVWGVQWHPEADADLVAGWPGTSAFVPTARRVHERLVASWRPLAQSFVALVEQSRR